MSKEKISQYFEVNHMIVFIGPKTDHCLPTSMIQSAKSVSDDLETDVTLAFEGGNSKLLDVELCC